eukprot:767240-Amphidinium_carterae.1
MTVSGSPSTRTSSQSQWLRRSLREYASVAPFIHVASLSRRRPHPQPKPLKMHNCRKGYHCEINSRPRSSAIVGGYVVHVVGQLNFI